MQVLAEKLLRYPLPRLLGPAFAGEWLRSGERLEARTGQVLFHAGSPGTHAYLLVAGQIRVLKVNSKGSEVSLGLFQPGQMFGEYALLPPHQNTASCRAAAPSCLVRLPLSLMRERLTPVLNGTPLKNWLRLHALLGFLREEAFLGFLTASSITPLLDRGIDLSIKAGNTIQTEGLMDDRWSFLRSGTATLQAEEGGPEASLGPGDCFGEGNLVGAPTTARVVAGSDVVCWTLPRDRFLASLRGGSKVSLLQTKMDTRVGGHRPCEWLPQRTAHDCGVAALTMAARHLGLGATQDQVASLIPLDQRGASVRAVGDAARRLGLHASAVRIGAAQLCDVRLPAVAHQRDGHFVALFRWKDDRLLVGDPASGIQALTVDAFADRWSGHLLLLALERPGPC